ncbi:hypothetical protein GCM10025771_41120 [Niveibacterium umoris]|uniref:Uncharacterized protein n=1 Tax=Niveibacterium umoris TaxID=1193620 RepID=A0A840BTI9_9RHOO|nr:hypothetical protein [Niveibacterium umoris]MBB4014992.1 hypothetical protein [Niveibacterium umoris]
MFGLEAFVIFADYNQFFLLDDALQPSYPEHIPAGAFEQRVQTLPNLLAIYTASAGNVSVSVVTNENEPEVSLEAWSHAVQGAISVPSRRLLLAGCSDYLPECPRVSVPATDCRFLLVGRGFEHGSAEEYRIHLWPGPQRSTFVVKQYDVRRG